MRFSTNNGTSYDSSSIYSVGFREYFGTTDNRTSNGTADYVRIFGNGDSMNPQGGFIEIDIYNPANTSKHTAYKTYNVNERTSGYGNYPISLQGYGTYRNNAAVDAVQLWCNDDTTDTLTGDYVILELS